MSLIAAKQDQIEHSGIRKKMEDENETVSGVTNFYMGDVHNHFVQAPADLQPATTSQQSPQQPISTLHDTIFPPSVVEVKSNQPGRDDLDVVPYNDKLNAEEIPNVSPILMQTDIYKGIDRDRESMMKPSTQQLEVNELGGKQTSITDLVSSLTKDSLFIGIVGPPGCGKTTLSKRLSKQFPETHLVLHFRFMYLNFGEEKLTLQELLLDRQLPDLEKSVCDSAFRWMTKNQKRCVLNFDGLDQATWTLENVQPVAARYDTRLTVQQIFANLCSRRFLGKSSLIVTSRPHSMLSLPLLMRPNTTVYVHDLSKEDMEVLFSFYAGEKAIELRQKIESNSPHILQICHNPMLLQFVIYATLSGTAHSIDTLTSIFNAVLEQLGQSDHGRMLRTHNLKKSLGKMAYNGMLRKSVVFTCENLKEVDLLGVQVQDVVIKVARRSWMQTRCVFEGGDALFYFMHQMLQELFAAYFMVFFMVVEEFKEAIDDVVKGSHWSMVRRFLCGLLLGNECAERSGGQTHSADKREIFLTQFSRHVQSKSGYSEGNELIELLVDLQECSNEMKNKIAQFYPRELFFSDISLSITQCHALADFLPRIDSDVEYLEFQRCELSHDKMNLISKGIKQIKHKLLYLDIRSNAIGIGGGHLVCGILSKIVEKLFVSGSGMDPDSVRMVKEALPKLEHPLEVDTLDPDEQNFHSDSA